MSYIQRNTSIDITKVFSRASLNSTYQRNYETFNFVQRNIRYNIKYVVDGSNFSIIKISKAHLTKSKRVSLIRTPIVKKLQISPSSAKSVQKSSSFTQTNPSKIVLRSIGSQTFLIVESKGSQIGLAKDCDENEKEDNLKLELAPLKRQAYVNNEILNQIAETIVTQNGLINNNFQILNNVSNLIVFGDNLRKTKKELNLKIRRRQQRVQMFKKYKKRTKYYKLFSQQKKVFEQVLSFVTSKDTKKFTNTSQQTEFSETVQKLSLILSKRDEGTQTDKAKSKQNIHCCSIL